MAANQFKIIIDGDGGVGKSSFIKRLKTGEFDRRYIATLGVEVNVCNVNTNCGQVAFNIWDCAGQEHLSGLRDGYYIGANAAIIMVDQSCQLSYQKVPQILQDIQRICQNIPILLCANKIDLNPSRFNGTYTRRIAIRNRLDYTLISVKRNLNLDKPFQYFLRKLINEHCTLQ
tara:strand:- start:12446 stop:12964 length:519 start_codon:yes stop_codon:yes gene_type:complete